MTLKESQHITMESRIQSHGLFRAVLVRYGVKAPVEHRQLIPLADAIESLARTIIEQFPKYEKSCCPIHDFEEEHPRSAQIWIAGLAQI